MPTPRSSSDALQMQSASLPGSQGVSTGAYEQQRLLVPLKTTRAVRSSPGWSMAALVDLQKREGSQ